MLIVLIIGSIRVFCRIRPYLSASKGIVHQPISVESNKIVIRSGGSKKEFEFDKVFTQEESQGQFRNSQNYQVYGYELCLDL